MAAKAKALSVFLSSASLSDCDFANGVRAAPTCERNGLPAMFLPVDGSTPDAKAKPACAKSKPRCLSVSVSPMISLYNARRSGYISASFLRSIGVKSENKSVSS